jgi:hypothetical protein
MKKSLEAGVEIQKRMEAAARDLPQPIPAEQAALDAHRDELIPLLQSNDDEDWDDEYPGSDDDDWE